MEPTDLTIHVLEEIRDEIRSTNERVDGLGTRLDKSIMETKRGVTDLQTRLSSELVAVNGSVREVVDLLRERSADRGRLDRHDAKIADLQERVSLLEDTESH